MDDSAAGGPGQTRQGLAVYGAISIEQIGQCAVHALGIIRLAPADEHGLFGARQGNVEQAQGLRASLEPSLGCVVTVGR